MQSINVSYWRLLLIAAFGVLWNGAEMKRNGDGTEGSRAPRTHRICACRSLLTGQFRGLVRVASHLVLHALALALGFCRTLVHPRVLRSSLIEAPAKPYVEVARPSRGMSGDRILGAHIAQEERPRLPP